MSLYTPQRILGTGAFSSVFQANDIYGNTVAIKVLKSLIIGNRQESIWQISQTRSGNPL